MPRSAVDLTRIHEAAGTLEQILGRGFDLMHTRRDGWLIRRYDATRARVIMIEVDRAPEGQLAALLARHQRREKGNANGA